MKTPEGSRHFLDCDRQPAIVQRAVDIQKGDIMINEFDNLIRIYGGQAEKVVHQESEVIVKPSSSEKHSDDIAALSARFPLENGSTIDITLRELLELCPRTRRRTDAYNSLKTELSRHGVNICITAKSKKL